MRAAIVIACLAALLPASGCGRRVAAASVFTSIRPADCAAPSADIVGSYKARGLGVQQCPAPQGWRLLLVSSDENAWIDLVGPAVIWSGERSIVYESPIGHFPSVDSSRQLEWRGDAGGPPSALIVPVTGQDPKTLTASRSVLYVARLRSDRVCIIGRAAGDEEARRLADGSEGC